MSELTLTMENEAADEAAFVSEQLYAYNRAHVPDASLSLVRLFLRDADGAVRGGLLADVYCGWMYVSVLWVDEALRGGGHGRRLMERAEEAAAARGCGAVWLDTFSYQAPGFHAKLGYEVFGRLDDYPPGVSRFFLRKHLTP